MRVWQPEPGETELVDWWRPLLRASARARRADYRYWPIHIDEFRLVGRFDRDPRPAVWVYSHERNHGELLVDDRGRTYRFVEHRRGNSSGRLVEIPLERAVWQARLPEVVGSIWFDDGVNSRQLAPPGAWGDDEHPSCPGVPAVPGGEEAALRPASRPCERWRGHLRLVVSRD